VINVDALRASSPLLLLSVLDFKAWWGNQFNKLDNSLKSFHLLDGRTKRIEMMGQSTTGSYNWCEYYEDDEIQRICLPYKLYECDAKGQKLYTEKKEIQYDLENYDYECVDHDRDCADTRATNGPELSMYFFLPRTQVGLPALLRQLNGEKLLGWIRKRTPFVHHTVRAPDSNELYEIYYDVWVTLPKFSTQSEADLKDALREIGVDELFSQGRAVLSGIADGAEGLFAAALLHKTVVSVNELGTEASASACTPCTGYGGPPPRTVITVRKHFNANHPFLYAIVLDKQHVLFIGTLCDVEERDCEPGFDCDSEDSGE